MTLVTSPEARFLQQVCKMLKQDEGLRLFPYDDKTGEAVRAMHGRITIGYGYNIQDRGIPQSVARLLLELSAEEAIREAKKLFTDFEDYSVPQRLALVNMIFQLGIAGFVKFKSTIEAVRNKDWEAAARHALDSLWAKQVPTRAYRVTALMRGDSSAYFELRL